MRPSVLGVSLSPDGTKLATVESNGARGSALRVLDLTTTSSSPRAIVGFNGDPERMDGCSWAGVRRLLCNVYGSLKLDFGDYTYFNRLVAIDADGGNMQVVKSPGGRPNMAVGGYTTFGGSVIDWNTGKDGHVLVIRRYVPEFSTGTKISNDASGLGVDDIDTNTLRSVNVEKAKARATEYITDGHGRIRLLGMAAGQEGLQGYSTGQYNYLARPKDSDNWGEIGKLDAPAREGFNPHYVDRQRDVVYGVKKLNGRLAAYSVAMDGSRKETLLLARADVDIGGFATIGRSRRVIGITYSTDRNEVQYFDPAMKALAAGLSKAMPQSPIIRIVDASDDEKKLLIWAGSDVDPGHYFLLDRTTNAMEELTANRLPLEGVALSTVRSISIPAADGAMIPAYLTLPPGSDGKNLPAIVLPHGGPSSRDEWGFDWIAQFWSHIGYAVLQPNFRGSDGYGDEWFQKNGFQSWRTAIGDVTDSGHWLVKQGIADPNKLAIVGWSYGGYAALQTAATQSDLFKAVIAIAPVTDLALLKEQSRNWSNFEIVKAFVGDGKHIEEGAPIRNAAKIMAPVLMFHGNFDRNVELAQSQVMAKELQDKGKSVRLVTYDKLDHYLDDSLARQDMLEQSAKFLETSFAAAK